MNLKGITGIGAMTRSEGIGNIERKPALHAANIAAVAVARNAFLLMLRTNIIGMASIMNLKSARTWQGRRNPWLENVKRLWYNLGGTNFDSLVKAYQTGSTRRALGAKLIGKLPKKWIPRYITALKDAVNFYKSRHNIDIAPKGIGEAATGTTAATIVAALPVVVQILEILANDFKPATASEQEELLDQMGTSEEELEAEEQRSQSPFSSDNLIKFGIPIAIVGGAILFLSKRK